MAFWSKPQNANQAGPLSTSCITDTPLPTLSDDRLSAREYADALADFIVNADTPVTIGIQGGWGSGKTSLITVLQEILDTQEKGAVLCVPVNAWENSLFHSADGKAEVALSLLGDLAEGVEESVAKAAWLPDQVKNALGKNSETISKAISGIKMGVMFMGKVGLQMFSNAVGGGDVSHIKANQENVNNMPTLVKNVRALKNGLEGMVNKIVINGKPVKVVFFIDDLDRVPPPTAVEILDLTKNIFNIPHCVFVLAIDYEVVVKGLEEKFGQKTAQNEREFRQYFDKIIQIPFTMPTGVYGDKLNAMLKSAFERLNLDLGEIDQATLNNLAEDARWVTGGNPRSIKRIINTLSLLQHIAKVQAVKKGEKEQEAKLSLLEARFIIVAMYINYPEICRRLMENPNYTEWNPKALNLKWKLRLNENEPQLEALAGEEWCNDPWEKTVYCLCSQSEWLKSQARNVSLLLNKLLLVLDPTNKPDKPLSEISQERLQSLLESIRVVSIDLDQHEVPAVDDKKVKTDRVSVFDQTLQNELAQKFPSLIPQWSNEYAMKKNDREYIIYLNKDDGWIVFNYSREEETFSITVGFPKGELTIKKTKELLEKALAQYEDKYEFDADKTEFWIWLNITSFTWDDFLSHNQVNMDIANQIVNMSVELLQITQQIARNLG